MGNGIILHLLDFSEFLDIAQSFFQRNIKLLPGIPVCKVLVINLGNAFFAPVLFIIHDQAEMLIKQVIQGIDPRRDRYCAPAYRKVHIGCTALRRNHRFPTFRFLCMRTERMSSGATAAFKIILLHGAAQTALGAAGTFHPHICKRGCIAN